MKMYEDATSIPCPSCGVEAGVWCGPVIEEFWRPITPWCHERRVRALDNVTK